MALKDAIDKLGAAIKDWSELEVATFTGEVTNVITGGTTEIDWDNLMSKANAGTIRLVAATRIKVDGDAYHFQANAAIERLPELLQAHSSAVGSSLAVRKSILKFFEQTIKNSIRAP